MEWNEGKLFSRIRKSFFVLIQFVKCSVDVALLVCRSCRVQVKSES
jgi:hypothetical protein